MDRQDRALLICSLCQSPRRQRQRNGGCLAKRGAGVQCPILGRSPRSPSSEDPSDSHAQWKCPSGNGTCHFKLATRQRTDHCGNPISKMEATSAGREQMGGMGSASCSSILDALKLWIPLCGGCQGHLTLTKSLKQTKEPCPEHVRSCYQLHLFADTKGEK